MKQTNMIFWFKEISKEDVGIAGGKGASLGEMLNAGIPVPNGFVISANTFDRFIDETEIFADIDAVLHKVNKTNFKDINSIENASEEIKSMIMTEEIPKDIKKEILSSFKKLGARFVAVRSSATSEDSSTAAWAGQLDSYLNTTEKTLLENVKKCWASLFTPRAIFYRFEKNMHNHKISVAVVVQKMIESEVSGVAFSVHPVTQDYNQLIIGGAYGLGEAIVSGQITPDSYVVEKKKLEIIEKIVNVQEKGIFRAVQGNEWKEIKEDKEKQKLTDKQIIELAKLVVKIEYHYGFPVDIEWALEKGKFYIVQSRPITTLEKIVAKKENRNFIDKNWVKYWEGGYSFLSCTYDGYALTKSMEKHFGKSFCNCIIIRRNNRSTGYLVKEEIEMIGKYLANKIIKKEGIANEWIKKFQKSSANLIKQIKAARKTINEKNYHSIIEKFLIYASFNAGTKTALEYLPSHLLERFLPKFSKIRASTEESYPIMERFLKTYTEKLSKKIKISAKLCNYFTKDEIDNITKINPKEYETILEKRKGDVVLVFEKGNYTFLLGQEVLKIENAITHIEETNEFSGVIAYGTGKIKGIVKIILDPKQEKEFKKGDILVAVMTRPEYTPFIKMASAIITDAGGVLSHAAIVARELKKPCIVGTKVATKILKDGDLVEVDADTGLVRKIDTDEKKIKWYYIINRPRCALINSIMMAGINQRFEDKIPIDYLEKNAIVLRGIWYADENEDARIKNEVMAQLEKNNGFLMKLIRVQETKWISFERYLVKLKKYNFKEKSISALKNEFDKISQFLIEWNSICLWLLWLPEKPLEQKLRQMLGQKLSKKEAEKAFLLVTTPAKDGFFEQEKASLARIAKLIRSKKSYAELFDAELDEIEKSIAKQPILKKKIAKHLAEFSWLSNTDFKSIFWDEKAMIERVKDMLDKNAFDDILRASIIKNEKEVMIKQQINCFKLNKKDIALIKTARELVHFRTFRTDIQWKTGYYAQPLFQEIARRLKISFKDFHELFYSEISDSLKKGSLDQSFVIKRETPYAILVEKGVMKYYYGEAEITRLEKKFKTEVDAKVTELKGTIANLGFASGRVRIVNTTEDIQKVEVGDVIVTVMTKPKYITAMEKAVAFVTDEGGMLCHAAIIARELKKPCVIGTKIATKLLKDGDLVEVDAIKGVVRKIK